MKKEEIKRDKNGRFVKKSAETKKSACVNSKRKSMKEEGCSKSEREKELEFERDVFHRLSERLGSDYLNKCVEINRYNTKIKEYDQVISEMVEMVRERDKYTEWLRDNLGWLKKRIYAGKIKAEEIRFCDTCNALMDKIKEVRKG